jgi:hypothetical protein
MFSVFGLTAFVCVVIASYQTWQVYLTGRLAHREGHPYARTQHARARKRLVWIMIAVVCIIEVQVRLNDFYQTPEFGPLFLIHTLFIISFLGVSLAVKYRFSGEKNPEHHRIWVYYIYLPIFLGLVVTGVLLAVWH